MRGFIAFLFIVTLPLLAVLGHDAYLYYMNQQNNVPGGENFLFSDVGFLWNQYSPDTLAVMKGSFDPGNWEVFYLYVLKQQAAVIAGVFACFFYIMAFLFKLFRIWPFNEGSVRVRRKNRKVDVILGDAKTSDYKYKRK